MTTDTQAEPLYNDILIYLVLTEYNIKIIVRQNTTYWKTFYKQKSITILDLSGLEIICVYVWIHNPSLVYTYIHMC